MRGPSKLRPDIQALRGIAVLAVVLFHTNQEIFKFGYLGVDLFFVVSGYVITPILINLSLSQNPFQGLKRFYESRIRRLIPSLAIVLVGSSILMLFLGPLSGLRYFSSQGIAAFLGVSNLEAFRLSQGNYFHPNPNALLHTWSLSAEEQIYLIVPIFFLVWKRIKKKFTIWFYLVLLCLSYFIFFFASQPDVLFFHNPWVLSKELIFYLPISRAWEFALGAIAFHMSNGRRPHTRINKLLLYLTFIVFILLLILFHFPAEATSLLTALLLFDSYQFNSKQMFVRALIWIGDRSYVIYLVHLPVIFLVKNSPLFLSVDASFRIIIGTITIYSLSTIISAKWEHKWRDNSTKQKVGIKSLIIYSIVVPLIIFTFLRVGAVSYFGFAEPPKIQGTISCVDPGPYGECNFNFSQSSPRILLIGDSHAMAISRSVTKVARELNFSTTVMSGRGCQILPLTNKYTEVRKPYRNPKSCEELISNIQNFIRENSNAHVFIMQRSIAIPHAGNTIKYQKLILEGIRQIKSLGSNVVVFGSVPEYQEAQSQGLSLELFRPTVSREISSLRTESFQEDRYLMRNLAKSKSTFVPIAPEFCSSNYCKLKFAGKYFYWDDNHLSLFGAEHLEKLFKGTIKNLSVVP